MHRGLRYSLVDNKNRFNYKNHCVGCPLPFVQWHHLCLQVDTLMEEVRVALDGNILDTTSTPGLTTAAPTTLEGKVVVGTWEQKDKPTRQFQGQVANVNLYKEAKDLGGLSRDLCRREGDLLAWSSTSWRNAGELVVEEHEEDEVCSTSSTYTLVVPLRMAQVAAVRWCAKLGGGRMWRGEEQEQVEATLGRLPASCTHLWTPYSDTTSEGTFTSLEDGSEPTFLPMGVGQPNGGHNQNGVSGGAGVGFGSGGGGCGDFGDCGVVTVHRGGG